MSDDYLDDWDRETIDGARLLNRLHGALTLYVIFPSPEAADAVTFIGAHCLSATR